MSIRKITRRRWTAQEDRQLKALYPNKSNEEIAALFHRTEQAINSRANQKGYSKSKDYLTRMGRDNLSHRWGSSESVSEPTRDYSFSRKRNGELEFTFELGKLRGRFTGPSEEITRALNSLWGLVTE